MTKDTANKERSSQGKLPARQLGMYFAKAVLLVVLVYLLSLALPAMPSLVVALFWIVFTLMSMLGVLYQASINKVNKQQKFITGGIAARANNGRSIRLIISFALSAWLTASLLLESPKWDIAEWALIMTAVLFYPLVKIIVRKRTIREYEQIFETAGTLFWTSIITSILLCAGYAVCSAFGFGIAQPQTSSTVFDALVATPQPFKSASSALLQEAGTGIWISDSIIHYGITQLSQAPWPACVAIRVALCASAFFGMANLLGVCSLSHGELRKVFIPTDAIKNNNTQTPLKKRYIILTAFLSTTLAIGFLWADGRTDQAMQTEGGTALQSLARQLAGQSIYIIDGKYYDQAKIDDLALSLTTDQARFYDMAFTLRDSAEDVYATLDGNVNSFLDWYFSIAIDESVRSSIPADNVQQALENHFYTIVAADEDEQITKEVKDYLQAASDLKTKVDTGYSQAEVPSENYANLPNWFVEAKEITDAQALDSCRQQAEHALDAAYDSGLTSAFAEGDSLLEHQFKNHVYENDPFETWAEKTSKAINGDIPSNIESYFSSVFQNGKDSYCSEIKDQLEKCRGEIKKLSEGNMTLA